MHSTNRTIALTWLETFKEHNLEKLLELYHDDAEHYSPKLKLRLPATQGLIKGKASLRSWWRDSFDRLPTLRYEVISLTANDQRVFMEYIRHVDDEEDMRVGEVLEITANKIKYSRVYHS